MIYIGIDPGVKTGICVMEDGAIVYIDTMGIIEAIGIVHHYDKKDVITLVIEDARQRKWFNGGRERLQGVGSVKRDCQIWEEYCNGYGINLIKVAPKNNKTKLTPEAFEKITGYTKRTSNHARDAAMLVWGRK